MKQVLSALMLVGGVAALATPGLAAAPIPEFTGGTVPSLAPMLSTVTPGVVNIAVKGRVREENPLLQDPFFRRFFNLPKGQDYQERETQATGSGVIVDAAQGYVLTNAHVVENETSIIITTKDNRKYPAKLVGRDAETDVAVLKIEPGHLAAIRTSCRSAISSSRSATPSGSARPSPRASSAPSAAAGSASRVTRISSRPTHRSIRAIPAVRSSICAAIWSASTPRSWRPAAAISASASRCRSTWRGG
jgi:S1-C subfamily serine protease